MTRSFFRPGLWLLLKHARQSEQDQHSNQHAHHEGELNVCGSLAPRTFHPVERAFQHKPPDDQDEPDGNGNGEHRPHAIDPEINQLGRLTKTTQKNR